MPESPDWRSDDAPTPDLHIPPSEFPEHAVPRSPRRAIVRTAMMLGAIFLSVAGAAYALTPPNAPENPLDYDPVTLEPKPPEGLFRKLGQFVFSKDVVLSGEHNDRINILLLGIGGEGHDGPQLADTMILAGVKPSTGQVAMVSIPRDLLVDIPDKGPQKINAANAYGEAKKANWGGALASEVVDATFDTHIDYYIRVDFRAFREIIDTVDGVTISVDRSFQDPMYPDDSYGYQTVSFARGVQQMDGATALQYARSRHGSNGEGSDFARSARQQKVLFALKEKILSAATLTNPVRIKGILDSLERHITTNMSFPEILSLVRMAKTVSLDNISTLTLDTSEGGYLEPGVGPQGAFVLVPKGGSFDPLRLAIKNIFDAAAPADDTPRRASASVTAAATASSGGAVEIQNGTWHAGLAARMKKRLTDASFAIGEIGNSALRPIAQSGIYAVRDTASAAHMNVLKNELHIPVKQTLPKGVTPAAGTDILILLGEDIQE
jgi:LCP family protein required for cell wall assembly